MSKTATRIAEPARHRSWGLTVDKRAGPTEYVIIRYATEGHRHSEPFTEVLRLPYIGNADQAIAELVNRTEMPKPTAISLVFALGMKLASPKSGDADLGYRPVS